MEEKDNREIWIGEDRFYLGENNILYETIVGEIDEKTALASKEATIKMRSKVEGRLNILIDVTRAGKPTPEARKICVSSRPGKRPLRGLRSERYTHLIEKYIRRLTQTMYVSLEGVNNG